MIPYGLISGTCPGSSFRTGCNANRSAPKLEIGLAAGSSHIAPQDDKTNNIFWHICAMSKNGMSGMVIHPILETRAINIPVFMNWLPSPCLWGHNLSARLDRYGPKAMESPGHSWDLWKLITTRGWEDIRCNVLKTPETNPQPVWTGAIVQSEQEQSISL